MNCLDARATLQRDLGRVGFCVVLHGQQVRSFGILGEVGAQRQHIVRLHLLRIDRRASCMEPIRQLSGYQQGAYVSPKDNATHYFYRGLSKGKHVIETTYYIDRAGQYNTGTCTVGCAYAPEYRATAPSMELRVNE